MRKREYKTQRGAEAAQLVKQIERKEIPHVLTREELGLISPVTLRRLVREGRVDLDSLSSSLGPVRPRELRQQECPVSKYEIN